MCSSDGTADMVRNGMVAGAATATEIEVWISDRTMSDHFHDHIDRNRFTELSAQFAPQHKPTSPTPAAHRDNGFEKKWRL